MDEFMDLIVGVGLLLIIIVPVYFIYVYYDEETKRKQNQKMEATDKEDTFSIGCENDNRIATPEANKSRSCSKKKILKNKNKTEINTKNVFEEETKPTKNIFEE